MGMVHIYICDRGYNMHRHRVAMVALLPIRGRHTYTAYYRHTWDKIHYMRTHPYRISVLSPATASNRQDKGDKILPELSCGSRDVLTQAINKILRPEGLEKFYAY